MKIAVSGKGGVGKTTFSALLCRSFAQAGRKVIAIDADPDANLAYAVGFEADVKVTPLVEMKELITERVGAEPGKATVYFKMNPKVDDIPDKFSVQHDNIRLLAMGTIRRGGSGCACPENVIVKQLISHLLIQDNEVVVLDMEAGIEHLGRGTTQFVDALMVVVEPGVASFHTFERIEALAKDLKIPRVVCVANKVRGDEDKKQILGALGDKAGCFLPLCDELKDYHGTKPNDEIEKEIQALRNRLQKEMSNGK